MERKMDDIISKEYGSTPKNVKQLTVEQAVSDILQDIVYDVLKEDKSFPKINSTQALIEKEQREKHGFVIPELDIKSSKIDDDEV